MSDQREPFVMPNEPPLDAEVDEIGGLLQREPERWTRNPIRPDECPHCQEYDWPEVWQLRADYDRVVEERDVALASRESWKRSSNRETNRADVAEREAARLRKRHEMGAPQALLECEEALRVTEREVERKREEVAAWLQRAEIAEHELAQCNENRLALWQGEHAQRNRTIAAEREVERLREALREIADSPIIQSDDPEPVLEIARAALAEPEEGEE